MELTIGPMEHKQEQPAQNATNDRPGWPCGEPPTLGYPADRCLRDALEKLRPWTDEVAVTIALQAWWDGHYGRPMRGDVADVAAALGEIGAHWIPLPDAESVTGMTAFSLVKVYKGRKPDDNDMLREVVKGIPASTTRRYRQRFGEEAFHEYMRHMQYGIDRYQLVKAGRTKAAARRWLERNPGKHFPDAPPPRRPRGSGPARS